MVKKTSFYISKTIIYVVLILLALLCILPLLYMLAVSLSDKVYSEANLVGLWPKGFTFDAYQTLFEGRTFFRAFGISVERTVLGTAVNVVLTILLAYPMSKTSSEFRGRTFYMIITVFTMVFGAGLVPYYIFMRNMNLFDTVWALILPGAVPAFNVMLMMNYMRGLPKDIEEAAAIDGAGYFIRLVRVVLPISIPSVATITLFSIVTHWNSWYDGLLYNNVIENYPLQTYLQALLTQRAPISINDAFLESAAGSRSLKCAQIFLTMLPILIIYPILQRYFVSGIVLGSVKG